MVHFISNFKILCLLVFIAQYIQVSANNLLKEYDVIDFIVFGDLASERQHMLEGSDTKMVIGALEQPARMLGDSKTKTGYDLKFTVKIDPLSQNYFTLKFWGTDSATITSKVFIDGKQIGYNRTSDYSPINGGFSCPLPGRFYYSTIMLPLNMTLGKYEAEITIQSQYKTKLTNREIYNGYVHTNPYLDFSLEKQGQKPRYKVAGDITDEAKDQLLSLYRELQIQDFNNFSRLLDQSPDAKISIVKYRDELRYYASMLSQPWCPAKDNAEKKRALFRIFQVIDNYVKDYYSDYRLVMRGGHQGDWGGFLGALGEALYIVENLISDDQILGEGAFGKFLDQPFSVPVSDSEFALPGKDWNGNPLTRKSAWERALKANFDFARSRLSYIYNQVYYTYDGAWKAHEGLRIIGSQFFEGKERSHQILREALGIAPFLGEEVLVSADGRDLDLYHSLFYHDWYVLFTDDFTYVVAKGLAKSKLDASGKVIRRLPYGRHHTGISQDGMPRENGYVGNYGETPNYLPEWFYKTLGHKGDEVLNDDILKVALHNLHARGYTRYTALDGNGNRIMRMQQVVDNRNAQYPGMYAYAVRQSHAKILHYASLERHMASHPERYNAPCWKPYWEYAEEAVGFAQQQLADNQYFPNQSSDVLRKNILDLRKYDYCLPEVYKYISSDRGSYGRFKETAAGKIHPLTDLDYYSDDELRKLSVNRNDYSRVGWADIDCMMACVKDGDKVLTGIFNFHNMGYSGCGRMHVQNADYDHIVQLATKAKYRYNEYYLRGNSLENDFRSDVLDIYTEQPSALAGEVCPVTYQPGVGRILRENFNEDNPYSAFPDYLESQYGQYLFVFNTTRPEYENEQNFEILLPKDYRKKTILDLISGKMLPVVNGKVTIVPNSALVLKFNNASYRTLTPDAVTFVTTLAGNNEVSVNWKPASGAEHYIIKRSFEENGKYEPIARGVKGNFFVDKTIKNDTTAFYKVVAVNKYGESWDSYRSKINLNSSGFDSNLQGNWRSDRIGDILSGEAVSSDSVIKILSVSGKGLGEGNDYMIHTRDINDSFLYIHTVVNGDVEIGTNIKPNRGRMNGLMLRDQLVADTRYIYLGCNEYGHIIFQNRSKNTQDVYYTYQISPYRWPEIHKTIFDYPYLKLVRNVNNHMVSGYISKDGKTWEKIGELFTPLPTAIYVGVGTAGAQNVSYEELYIK